MRDVSADALGIALLLGAWLITCGVASPRLKTMVSFGVISYLGNTGSSFLLSMASRALGLLLLSEPDAGGVGGRARLGGGDGSRGASSCSCCRYGVSAVVGVFAPCPLLLFIALRGIDADLGRGVYVGRGVYGFTITFAPCGGDLAFGTGISCATSITGLRAICSSAFALS